MEERSFVWVIGSLLRGVSVICTRNERTDNLDFARNCQQHVMKPQFRDYTGAFRYEYFESQINAETCSRDTCRELLCPLDRIFSYMQ